MILSQRLRQARRAKGLTQQELAKRIGFTQSGIAALESGVRRNPELQTLRKLADALEVTIGYLVGEESTEEQLAIPHA